MTSRRVVRTNRKSTPPNVPKALAHLRKKKAKQQPTKRKGGSLPVQSAAGASTERARRAEVRWWAGELLVMGREAIRERPELKTILDELVDLAHQLARHQDLNLDPSSNLNDHQPDLGTRSYEHRPLVMRPKGTVSGGLPSLGKKR